MTIYRVTAPMVLLKTKGAGDKLSVNGFYAGAVLPSSVAEVDADNLQRHVDRGWVEEVDASATDSVSEPAASQDPEPQTPDSDPDAVPQGSMEVVLAWVGDDQERAARALEAERSASKPRTTLVDQLTALAGQA
jgi:hypothetical protein